MAHYRKIDSRIWNDAKFSGLSDNGKLAFFMLLTHPNMTSLGAMRGTIEGLAAEIGWTPKAFREAFREASRKGMARYDERACLISLPNFIRYNPPESPNVLKAWVKSVDLLPECGLKNEVIQGVKAFAEGLSEGYAKALPKDFAKAMPNQEQEQEQEQDKDTLPHPADEDGRHHAQKDFDETFWPAYPRKVGKKDALKAFTKLNLDREALERIMAALEVQKQSEDWRRDDGRFIPHPATWLNGRRWEDEIGSRTEPDAFDMRGAL